MSARESDLAGFQSSRRKFVDAISGVPEDALAYLSPSDDYSLGGLITHVNAILRRYGRVLDGVLGDTASELDARPIDLDKDVDNARSGEAMTGPGRAAALTTLAQLHDHMAFKLGTLTDADWDRKTPVVFGGSEEPYPTSAGDLIGWLTGHYEEHVPHVAELLAGWQATATA
ncbi:MAG TPA: DinB family protein [Candidatus Dormibacteraeota bacterium]|jgi:hypothetical protein